MNFMPWSITTVRLSTLVASFQLFHRIIGEENKKTKHLNTDLDFDYFDSEALGSARQDTCPKSLFFKL